MPKNVRIGSDSNQGPGRTMLQVIPSMFSTYKMRLIQFVCENLLSILDVFSNRFSDTCKIQSSRFDRILWSHRWWKEVPSPKFVNIVIRDSNRFQVYHVSQIWLVLSSGWMGPGRFVLVKSVLRIMVAPLGSYVYVNGLSMLFKKIWNLSPKETNKTWTENRCTSFKPTRMHMIYFPHLSLW